MKKIFNLITVLVCFLLTANTIFAADPVVNTEEVKIDIFEGITHNDSEYSVYFGNMADSLTVATVTDGDLGSFAYVGTAQESTFVATQLETNWDAKTWYRVNDDVRGNSIVTSIVDEDALIYYDDSHTYAVMELNDSETGIDFKLLNDPNDVYQVNTVYAYDDTLYTTNQKDVSFVQTTTKDFKDVFVVDADKQKVVSDSTIVRYDFIKYTEVDSLGNEVVLTDSLGNEMGYNKPVYEYKYETKQDSTTTVELQLNPDSFETNYIKKLVK